MGYKIALHDADGTRFPNLALMKLSAWHKQRGDDVSWWEGQTADVIYSSKVFTFTPEVELPIGTIKGGNGYGNPFNLGEEVEHICPDYMLYDLGFSLGFTTRGCNRNCSWCIVPAKEGKHHAHAELEEFCRHKVVRFLDNNILAGPHGIRQLEKAVEKKVNVDVNQGIDARLIDDGIARLFKKLTWDAPIRLACDTVEQIPSVDRAVALLRWHNVTPSRYSCYVLVNDLESAIERVRFLKKIYVDPYCQPFMDVAGTPATQAQKHFCRWANMKAEFKSRPWEDYAASKGITPLGELL